MAFRRAASVVRRMPTTASSRASSLCSGMTLPSAFRSRTKSRMCGLSTESAPAAASPVTAANEGFAGNPYASRSLLYEGMPWSRPRWMSIAPRSCTPLKQLGSTTGLPQAAGFLPGFGTWKRTLRSELSICSSFRYWRSAERLARTGPTPSACRRSGFPNARFSGTVSSRLAPSLSIAIPSVRNCLSRRCEYVAGFAVTSNSPWIMLCAR